jgi:hypothetical protein
MLSQAEVSRSIWSHANGGGSMSRTRPWEWPLTPERLGHADRHAFIRAIHYKALDGENNRAAGERSRRSQKSGHALSLNISPGGMLLLMNGEPALQQQLKISLPLLPMKGPAPSLAEVCWTRSVPARLQGNLVFVGVRFVDPR